MRERERVCVCVCVTHKVYDERKRERVCVCVLNTKCTMSVLYIECTQNIIF